MSFDEKFINATETQQSTEKHSYSLQTNESFSKVAEIIVATSGCNIDDVTRSAKLEALGVDSLKAITVLFELEEAFDIEIPNAVIPTIVTVQDVMDKVDELNSNAA